MFNDIHLQNFRSYLDDSFDLSPNVNIIVGPNTSGKTNLLESILVAAKGSSYRAKDLELISFNKDWARIEVNTDKFNRIIKIQKMGEEKISKSYETNTNKTKRLSLAQTIPVVLFEPNNLLLLIGSPELRRSYIDDILEQTIPGFKSHKNQYKRALSQRNFLLKNPQLNNTDLFVWNVRLSEIGGKIFKERITLINKLQQDINIYYNSLSNGTEKIQFNYKTNINTNNYETNLLKQLEQTTESDFNKGFTAHGPHRDDLEILINNKPAGEVASRGETRSILLAMKVIEAKIIEIAREQKPLFLFDDVFSELDGARRIALTKILNSYQTIITTTDADVVIDHFIKNSHIIPLVKGI